MKILRWIIVLFGYKPWHRMNLISAWNEECGRAVVLVVSDEHYAEKYIEFGYKGRRTIIEETKKFGHEPYIIIDASKLPCNRIQRDDWTVSFNRECIYIRER